MNNIGKRTWFFIAGVFFLISAVSNFAIDLKILGFSMIALSLVFIALGVISKK